MPTTKLNALLPHHIKTPRLTLERYDSSPRHVHCCLAARNNAVTFAQVGDLGVHDRAELERRHDAARIGKEEFGAGVEVEVDLFLLYVLRLDEGEGQLVGVVHVHQVPNVSPELGYNMIPAFMGKGCMTEAVVAVCRVMREVVGVRRLGVSVRESNPASRRVVEKAGFVGTGETRVKGEGVVLRCLELPVDSKPWMGVE